MDGRKNTPLIWAEFEGIPDAFGNFSAGPEWYSEAPVREKFDQVIGSLVAFPDASPQTLDLLEGRTSVSTMGLHIADAGKVLVRAFGTRNPAGGMVVSRRFLLNAEYTGSAPDVAAFQTPQVMYSGVRTGRITGASGEGTTLRVTGQAWGLYRSRKQFGPSVGDVVSPHPGRLTGRHVWVWLSLDNGITRQRIFRGYIEGVEWIDGSTALRVDCADMSGEHKRPLFARAVEWGKVLEGADELYGYHLMGTNDMPSFLTRFVDGDIGVLIGKSPVPGDVDFDLLDYIIKPKKKISKKNLHERIEESVPVVLITRKTGGRRKHSPWAAGLHPLEVELQILTSTGAGNNGDYDTLGGHWGLHVPVSEVDVEAFEALIERTPGLEIGAVLNEAPEDGREWRIQNLYRPFGFFPRMLADGRFSVGTYAAPEPGYVRDYARRITEHDIIEWSGPSNEKRDVVTKFSFNATPVFDPEDITEPPETGTELRISGTLAESVSFSDEWADIDSENEGSEVEIDTVVLQDRRGLTFAVRPEGGLPHATQVAERTLELLQRRFRTPPTYIDLTLNLSCIDISIGDYVVLDVRAVPSVNTGERGLFDEIAEVVERQPDIASGTVKLRVAMHDLTRKQAVVRYLAPGSELVDTALTRFVIKDDKEAFKLGYQVMVMDGELFGWKRKGTLAFDVSQNKYYISPFVINPDAGAGTYVDGDVLVFAPHDECTEEQRSLFAFRGDAQGRLDGAEGHRWD